MNLRSTIPGVTGFLLSFWCFRSFVHDVLAPTWLWVATGIASIYVCILTYVLINGWDRLRAAEKLNRHLLQEIRKSYTEQ